MAEPFSWAAILIPAVMGGVFGGIACIVECFDKRDINATGSGYHDTIYQFNTTNLRGQDLDMLRGLSARLTTPTGAVFRSDNGLNTDGTMTGLESEPVSGLKHGGVSIQIPGLDSPAEGTWIQVDRRQEGNEKLVVAFDNLLKYIEETKAQPVDQTLAEVLTTIANQ